MKGIKSMPCKLLFSPFKIGKLEVKNRIVQAAMLTRLTNPDGSVSSRFKNYLVERARGGVGLIITDAAFVLKEAQFRPNQLGIYDDSLIPGLRDLVSAVKAEGAKIACQLHHAGRRLSESYLMGTRPVAPSAFPYIITGVTPHELTVTEIQQIVNAFAQGARRAKEAGYDAVEVHGAHGYLINQFLSPFTNKRTDDYGGDVERRSRFACEIVSQIRKTVGPDFPIIFRMDGDDYVEGGIKIDEAKRQAQLLVKAGVDALHVSAGIREAIHWQIPPNNYPKGCLIHLAAAIKRTVNVPIIGVGRINDPLVAEKILAEKKADLIAMARALLADPEFPKKAQEGRFNEIRQCIGCNIGCIDRDVRRFPAVTCEINPTVGMEEEYRLKPAKTPKNILIVGAGPAGMEAAITAAQRGHKVTLCEKTDSLGGQLIVASRPKHKRKEFQNLINFFSNQLAKLGVEIEFNREVTPDYVAQKNPEAVILATGATPIIPDIPGVKGTNVVQANDVLMGKAKTGKRVAVVGGGLVGIETAEFLAQMGKTVTIIEMLEKIAADVNLTQMLAYRDSIKELGIYTYTKTKVTEITGNGVLANMENELIFFEADTVVLAVGSRPNDFLAQKLSGLVPKVIAVGDCVRARRIIDAIHEGFHAAREI